MQRRFYEKTHYEQIEDKLCKKYGNENIRIRENNVLLSNELAHETSVSEVIKKIDSKRNKTQHMQKSAVNFGK